MSWLGDIFDFEKFNLGYMWDRIKENPEQLLLGAADPFGAKLWGGITGKEFDPIINQWGGASDGAYAAAEAAGIDTGAGRQAHGIAELIASIYTGGAAMGALGGGAAAGGGAASGAGGWGAFGPGGGAWTGTGALSGGGAAGGFGSLGLGAGATGNTAAAGFGAFGPAGSAWSGAGSGGLSLDQFMQLVQSMPQGGGQDGPKPLNPAPVGKAPQGTGLLGPIAKGDTKIAERRRRRRRGLLEQ